MFRRVALFTAVWLIAGAALAQDRSGTAAAVLNHVNIARQAAAAHDQKAALAEVGQALTADRQILLESAGQPQPVLVTLSQDIETTTTYTPVKRLKNGELTADRLKRDTSIREVEATGTVSQLDATNAADRLTTAQTALQREDWAAADQALAQIQQSVTVTRVDGNMPLLQAHQNLELAKSRILEDKARDAAAPLRAAAQALADFERQSPGPDAERADFIRQQMLEQAGRVSHDHSDALDWINSWLATVERWERKTTVHH